MTSKYMYIQCIFLSGIFVIISILFYLYRYDYIDNSKPILIYSEPCNVCTNNKDEEIPKILHLTYHNIKKIPSKVYHNLQKFAHDYTIKIYSDEDGELFIRKYFTIEVVNRYKHLTGAHKADLLRYCLLYIEGGIYIDIKTELVQDLSSLFTKSGCIYLVIGYESLGNQIYNGIIGTPKRQKIFLNLIIDILYAGYRHKIDYLFNVRKLYNYVSDDVGKIQNGYNKGVNHNYYIWKEIVSRDVKLCNDKLDRYGFCSWIYDVNQNKKTFKTRYSDYPF